MVASPDFGCRIEFLKRGKMFDFSNKKLIDFYDTFFKDELEQDLKENHAKSPIEKSLCAAICICRSGSIIKMPIDNRLQLNASHYYLEFVDKLILNEKLKHQGKIKYIIDIAIYSSGGLKMAVECDGHDYHERTKEQAKHDKEKDRWLQSQGWFVARFTGSEIYQDAFAVVEKIGDILFEWESKNFAKIQGAA